MQESGMPLFLAFSQHSGVEFPAPALQDCTRVAKLGERHRSKGVLCPNS